jgi:hypothetical protein
MNRIGITDFPFQKKIRLKIEADPFGVSLN